MAYLSIIQLVQMPRCGTRRLGAMTCQASGVLDHQSAFIYAGLSCLFGNQSLVLAHVSSSYPHANFCSSNFLDILTYRVARGYTVLYYFKSSGTSGFHA